jgi:hypothetical protein
MQIILYNRFLTNEKNKISKTLGGQVRSTVECIIYFQSVFTVVPTKSIASFGCSHKDLPLVGFRSEGVANSVNPSKYKGQICIKFPTFLSCSFVTYSQKSRVYPRVDNFCLLENQDNLSFFPSQYA